jgi:hypothetical protein
VSRLSIGFLGANTERSMVTLIFHCSYEPEDALEWALVLDEIKGFIKADAAVSVLHADSNPIVLSHRCVLSVLDKTTKK